MTYPPRIAAEMTVTALGAMEGQALGHQASLETQILASDSVVVRRAVQFVRLWLRLIEVRV